MLCNQFSKTLTCISQYNMESSENQCFVFISSGSLNCNISDIQLIVNGLHVNTGTDIIVKHEKYKSVLIRNSNKELTIEYFDFIVTVKFITSTVHTK